METQVSETRSILSGSTFARYLKKVSRRSAVMTQYVRRHTCSSSLPPILLGHVPPAPTYHDEDRPTSIVVPFPVKPRPWHARFQASIGPPQQRTGVLPTGPFLLIYTSIPQSACSDLRAQHSFVLPSTCIAIRSELGFLRYELPRGVRHGRRVPYRRPHLDGTDRWACYEHRQRADPHQQGDSALHQGRDDCIVALIAFCARTGHSRSLTVFWRLDERTP